VTDGLGSCAVNQYKCGSGCCTCPLHSVSNSSSLSCSCAAGYYSSGFGSSLSCAPCPAGSTSPAGAVSCTCAGGYKEAGFGSSLRCTACPPGSDSVIPGVANCTCTGGKMFYGTQSCSTFSTLTNGDFEDAPVAAGLYTLGLPLGWYGVGGVNGYGGLNTQYSVYQVSGSSSAFGGGPAPSGSQYLVLEYSSTYVEQTLSPPAGTYALSFSARARPGYSPLIPFSVYVSGAKVFGATLSTAWTPYTVSGILVTGSVTLQFANDPTNDVGGLNYPTYIYYNELDNVQFVKGD